MYPISTVRATKYAAMRPTNDDKANKPMQWATYEFCGTNEEYYWQVGKGTNAAQLCADKLFRIDIPRRLTSGFELVVGGYS
jgi:hypothetical protein